VPAKLLFPQFNYIGGDGLMEAESDKLADIRCVKVGELTTGVIALVSGCGRVVRVPSGSGCGWDIRAPSESGCGWDIRAPSGGLCF